MSGGPAPSGALGARNAPAAAPSATIVPTSAPSIRVLVVDDSVVVRGAVGRLLDAEPDLTVVATAINGRQALEALAQRPADVVVLDVEMPEMDGLTALPLILQQQPGVRVLMLSVHGGRGADVTVRALALGAADFVRKPRAADGTGSRAAAFDAHAAEITGKVRALGRSAQRVTQRDAQRGERSPDERSGNGEGTTRPAPSRIGAPPGSVVRPPVAASRPRSAGSPSSGAPAPALRMPGLPLRRAGIASPRPAQVLAIAASTGGPVALAALLGALPPRLEVPVLVTQHMPPDFTRLLAERLAASSGYPCAEARPSELLRPGRVYVAPGDYHLLVERHGREMRIRLTQDPPVNHCRPAADPMFASVAAAYGPDVLGVVLTGMGHDGRDGAAAIVRAGGRVLAQDEATSVVWGMPGAVAQANLADAVLPIPEIALRIAACCAARPASARRDDTRPDRHSRITQTP